MGKHTAHGYLVEDVYKEAEKFTKLFGFKPAKERWSFFCGSGNI